MSEETKEKTNPPSIIAEPVSIGPPAKKIMTEAKRAALQKANEARALNYKKKKVLDEEYERDMKEFNALYGTMKQKWEKMDPETLLNKMKQKEETPPPKREKEELKPVKVTQKPKVELEEEYSDEESEEDIESDTPVSKQPRQAPPAPVKRKVVEVPEEELAALIAHAQRTARQPAPAPSRPKPVAQQRPVYRPKYSFDSFTPMYD